MPESSHLSVTTVKTREQAVTPKKHPRNKRAADSATTITAAHLDRALTPICEDRIIGSIPHTYHPDVGWHIHHQAERSSQYDNCGTTRCLPPIHKDQILGPIPCTCHQDVGPRPSITEQDPPTTTTAKLLERVPKHY